MGFRRYLVHENTFCWLRYRQEMLAFGFWLCSAKIASANSTEEEVPKPKWDCLWLSVSRASARKIKPEQSEDKGIHFLKQSRSAHCYWSHISRGDLGFCCRKAIYSSVVITSPVVNSALSWAVCKVPAWNPEFGSNSAVNYTIHTRIHTRTVHTEPEHVCLINWLSAWRLRVKPVLVAIMGLIYHCNFR